MKSWKKYYSVLFRLLCFVAGGAALLTVFCLGYTIWVAAMPETAFYWEQIGGSACIKIDGASVFISNRVPGLAFSAAEGIPPKAAHLWMLGISLLFSLPLAFLQFFSIARILKTLVTGETPFQLCNVRRIRILGVAMIGSAVLPTVANALAVSVLSGRGTSVLLTDIFPLVVAGLLVLVLAQVFSYGCALQQAQDDTV